jgi:TRAP-type C4-dicarboxylate transport system substrate-binding protein
MLNHKATFRPSRHRSVVPHRAAASALAIALGLAAAACSSSGSSSSGSTAAAGGSGSADNPKVSLQLEAYYSSTDPYVAWLKTLASKISTDTGGALSITVYPSSTLVSQANAPQAISSNTVSMGMIDDSDLDNFAKGLEVQNQAFYFTSFGQANSITTSQQVRDEKNSVLKKSNIMELDMCDGGFEYLISKQSISTPAQLSGVSVRTASASDDSLINTMGGIGTTVPIAEAYQALEQNVVQGVLSTPANMQAQNWYQVAKYVDLIPVKVGYADLDINTGAYDKLSANEQKVLVNDVAAATPQCNTLEQNSLQASLSKLKGEGVTLVTPTTADINEFVQKTNSTRQQYVSSTSLAQTMNTLIQSAVKGA